MSDEEVFQSSSEDEMHFDESGSDYDSSNAESEFSDDDSLGESDEEDEVNAFREWCSERLEPQLVAPPPPFPFLNTSAINKHFHDDRGILQYFNFFFDDELVDVITVETNRYAQQCLVSKSAEIKRKWHDTTSDEIRVFFAIILAQSIIRKPDEKLYWTKNKILHTSFFRETMPSQRFLKIKQYLHFSNNEEFDAATHPSPKLYKLWPIYQNLVQKFKSVYTPEKNIAIDESLLLYKGRLGWIQYIPMKRARFGIKTYLLCESSTGYVYNFIIYTGKETLLDEEYKALPISSQVVMTLVKTLLNKGYTLTTDNFYTSPQLADILVANKTDIYGTVRLNRKEMPPAIKDVKLKKGEVVAFRRGKVMTLRWKDKKDVTLLSTIHNAKMLQITKRDKVKEKPAVVHDYNDTMGGVDRVDQMLASYPLPRKRGKKYYRKIFFHLLDLAIFNSMVLYMKRGGQMSSLKYRLALITSIVETYHPNVARPSKAVGRPTDAFTPLRFTGKHYPILIPSTGKKVHSQKRCVLCSRLTDATGKKVRRDTRYMCDICEVPLCVVGCFKVYHTYRQINL